MTRRMEAVAGEKSRRIIVRIEGQLSNKASRGITLQKRVFPRCLKLGSAMSSQTDRPWDMRPGKRLRSHLRDRADVYERAQNLIRKEDGGRGKTMWSNSWGGRGINTNESGVSPGGK